MSNEELVKMIQCGDKEHVPQLWQQVEPFIDMQAGKWLDNYPLCYKSLRGDMVNQSYFYFLRAVAKYSDTGGSKFIGYLNYFIVNAFKEVLRSSVTSLSHETLKPAISLDIPISDEEDLTLLETLIDAKAEMPLTIMEDTDFWQSVNKLLHGIIETLPMCQSVILKCMLEYREGLKATMSHLGIDEAEYSICQRHYINGTRTIRNKLVGYVKRNRSNNIALDEFVNYYSSYRKWKDNCFTSVVEYAVIKRNDPINNIRNIGAVLKV